MQFFNLEELFKLILAATFGGLVGIERQIQGQTAGFRTQLLVCLGSCLFTISSIRFFEIYGKMVDPARISAQIVVGIGFLGAGAIIKQGDYVRGLTTAATLWVVSAIGLAVGLGEYNLSTFATFLTLINLIILKKLENILPRDNYSSLEIEYEGFETSDIHSFSKKFSIEIASLKESFDRDDNKSIITVTLKYKNNNQIKSLLNVLKNEPGLKKIVIK